MDIGNTFMRILQLTLSPENAARAAGEQQLRALYEVPGYLTALMTVISSSSAAGELRIAAALALKRACMKWDESDAAKQQEFKEKYGRTCLFAENEKELVKSSLVQLATTITERPIINALADTLRQIARVDFPHSWASLVPSLLAVLSSGSPGPVLTALELVHALFKEFEMEGTVHAEQGRSKGDVASALLIEPMLAIATALIPGPINEQAGAALSLVLKSYYRCIHFRFPRLVAIRKVASVRSWVGACMATLAKPMPAGERGSQDADFSWWHAKKWAITILDRFIQQWSSPSNTDALEKKKEARESAKALRNEILPGQILPTVLTCLREFVEGRVWLSVKVQKGCVQAVDGAWGEVGGPALTALTPHMAWIIGTVVPHVLKLSPDEMSAVECDPMSWLEESGDVGYGFSHDQRDAADALLLTVMEKKVGRTIAQPVLTALISRICSAAAAYPSGSVPPSLVSDKEMALRVLSLLSRAWRWSKAHRGQLQGLLTAYVSTDLLPASPPILRIRAVRTWCSFMDSDAISDGVKTQVVHAFLPLLSDANEAVRLVTANAISQVITMSDAAKEAVRPHVVTLLTGLFSMVDDLGHEMLVEFIKTLVQEFVGDNPQLAGPLAQKLSAMFLPMLKTLTVEEEPGDDLEMVAGAVLETLVILIEELTLGDMDGEEDEDEGGVTKVEDPAVKAKRLVIHAGKMTIARDLVVPEIWRLLDILMPPEGDLAVALGRPLEPELFLDFVDMMASLYGSAVQAMETSIVHCEAAWALWPRLTTLAGNEARDWMEDFALPIAAMVDYGRERFAAAGTPPTMPPGTPQALIEAADPIYSLLQMVHAVEHDAHDDTRVMCSRMASTALWNVWRTPGGMRLLAGLVPMYTAGLAASRPTYTKNACIAVLCTALIVNAPATVACWAGVPGGHALVLAEVVQAVPTLKRLTDIKIVGAGLTELLLSAFSSAALDSAIRPYMPSILSAAIECAVLEDRVRMDAQAVKANARKELAEDAQREIEEGSEAGDEEEEEEEEEEGGEGVDHEFDDGEVEDYDGGDDGQYLEQDNHVGATPLDATDTKLHLAQVIQALAVSPGAAELQAALSPDIVHKLQVVMAIAADMRAKGKVYTPLCPLPAVLAESQ